MIGVYGYKGVKVILRHFCKTRFSKFWAVSCELGFEVSIWPKNFFFTKFVDGYQNNTEYYADVQTVAKNIKKIANKKVIKKELLFF